MGGTVNIVMMRHTCQGPRLNSKPTSFAAAQRPHHHPGALIQTYLPRVSRAVCGACPFKDRPEPMQSGP